MVTPLYLSVDQFTLLLGETALGVFDTNGSRTVNSAAMTATLQSASRRATAAIAAEYLGTLPFTPDNVPEMVVELTYEYAIALMCIRSPDYMAALGVKLKDVLARADAMAKDIRASNTRLIDAEAPTPANVGGGVSSMASDPCFPAPPKPVFENMGDF